METSFRGTFVISWSQTEIDGLVDAPLSALTVGAVWSWRGETVRVDGPSGVLRLAATEVDMTRRRCAAKMVRRLISAAQSDTTRLDDIVVSDAPSDDCFVVTNGFNSFTVTVIDAGQGVPPLLMFLDEVPPQNTELWVVHQAIQDHKRAAQGTELGGVICFTPGTRIETPEGPRLVEELREGDFVQTKDNGAQEIQWIGCRRMSGARLFAMPHLRPVRIRPGALGPDRPDAELLVSPEHRMLLQGPVAQVLFNTPEVLIAARDLVNDRSILVDLAVREVTYFHILLPRHQIVWANGVESESFHPASAALSALSDVDRERLLKLNPVYEFQPHTYGDFARRSLTASETAILLHEAS